MQFLTGHPLDGSMPRQTWKQNDARRKKALKLYTTWLLEAVPIQNEDVFFASKAFPVAQLWTLISTSCNATGFQVSPMKHLCTFGNRPPLGCDEPF